MVALVGKRLRLTETEASKFPTRGARRMPWRLAVGKKQMVLQGMEDALTKQRKFRSAVPHTFDEFQFIHFSFYQTIILR